MPKSFLSTVWLLYEHLRVIFTVTFSLNSSIIAFDQAHVEFYREIRTRLGHKARGNKQCTLKQEAFNFEYNILIKNTLFKKWHILPSTGYLHLSIPGKTKSINWAKQKHFFFFEIVLTKFWTNSNWYFIWNIWHMQFYNVAWVE